MPPSSEWCWDLPPEPPTSEDVKALHEGGMALNDAVASVHRAWKGELFLWMLKMCLRQIPHLNMSLYFERVVKYVSKRGGF